MAVAIIRPTTARIPAAGRQQIKMRTETPTNSLRSATEAMPRALRAWPKRKLIR
jgi:hypothetical protein